MEDLKTTIRKYALHNAVKYEGKANQGAVIGRVLGELPDLKNKIKDVAKTVAEVLKDVNSMKVDAQLKELQKLAPELLVEEKKEEEKKLPELKDAVQGKVVMRVAPSPSGPLHVGHAYAFSASIEYCRTYDGKLILRIEDTNPENIDPQAYDLIPDDLNWLSKNGISKVIVQSDRLSTYYDYADRLLQKGHAYVCTCSSEAHRELNLKGNACPCRELLVKEQLLRWDRMFGEYKPGEAIVRIKTDLNAKNPAWRDWPALRINDHVHPRQGTKYRVWPLMNFAVFVDDVETGVTHSIRGKDHMDNEQKQLFLYRYLDKKPPFALYVGRINFLGMPLSTTETRQKIERGEYSGWDDIRLPFLRALSRRGYNPDAFVDFGVQMFGQNDKTISEEEYFTLLNDSNKRYIQESNRYFFVQNPVELTINGAPEKEASVPLHPDYKDRGFRTFKTHDKFYITQDDFRSLKDEKLYRLMDCLNFRFEKSRLLFDSLEHEKYKQKGERIFHWLPVSKDNVKIEVLMPDNSVKTGLGEHEISSMKVGEVCQFERFGFVRLDKIEKGSYQFWFTHR